MSEIVIREITPEVTIFSSPFTRFFGLFAIGGRSTAIKLTSGLLWIVASTPFTAETKDAIDKMGTVGYILAANVDHHFFLSQWKRAYPAAVMIGVDGLEAKKKEDWRFDGLYGVDWEDTKYGFEDEIQSCYFSGFAKKDVAWFHLPSKTLIVADLVFNLPANEQHSQSKTPPKLPFFFPKFDPYSQGLQRFLWAQGKNTEAMQRNAKTVAFWDFERIIPCHGDVIEKDAKKAWKAAYKRYL
ncbi:hypothetical protein QCA50_013356 [Cerrena zonata]|uniref:DUF4336 domain-containing protein n=1 Tax=Cerrena zonata TaxID=2478898 RepID=A0AAW0FW14_9APHY